jgi:hypothetical protein
MEMDREDEREKRLKRRKGKELERRKEIWIGKKNENRDKREGRVRN